MRTVLSQGERHRSRRLVGLVVKASASGTGRPGFDSCLRRESFSRSSHTRDLKTGTPMVTLPDLWRLKVRAGAGRPGASIQ